MERIPFLPMRRSTTPSLWIQVLGSALDGDVWKITRAELHERASLVCHETAPRCRHVKNACISMQQHARRKNLILTTRTDADGSLYLQAKPKERVC